MKLDHPLLYKFAALLGTTAVRAWMDTLDYRVLFYDPDVDPASPRCRGQKIYVFWHEYILFPFAMRGNCNLAMLLSRHRDAEVLSYAARHMGFDFVRGSTNRGGVAALRQLLDKSRKMHLAITPDGPRGPRRQLAPGPVYLASKLGIPLVAMGVGYRAAVAGAELGPFRHPAAVQPGSVHSLAGIARPARVGPRWAGTLSPEGRATAQSSLRRGGTVGRVRQPQAGPTDAASRLPAAPAACGAGPAGSHTNPKRKRGTALRSWLGFRATNPSLALRVSKTTSAGSRARW